MVDHLDQQLLLVQLQERHTWNHDRVFAHQALRGRLGGIIPQKLLEDPHDMSGTGVFSAIYGNLHHHLKRLKCGF